MDLELEFAEYTKTIPKPMINIGNKPIIYHIMKHYSKYGFKNFYIALGYKGHVIRKYFSKKFFDWNVNLIETGKKYYDGRKIKKRLKKILSKERFMITYGDGLSNVNINKLLDLHKKNKKKLLL